jgi:hypothetical protein
MLEVNCGPVGRLPPRAVSLSQPEGGTESLFDAGSTTCGMARGVHLEQAGEDTKMKTKLLALIALAGGSLFAQSRFSVGVAIGSGPGPAYYRPAPVVVAAPAYRPGFIWVAGYWDHSRFGRTWVPGHYVRRAAFRHYREYPRYDYPRYR